MFICSFKLNKTRVLSVVAALCLSLTLVFLMLPEPTGVNGAAGEKSTKSEAEMVEYLSSIGHTVAPQALLIEKVVIPEKFDEEYKKYNELQKESGYNLEEYAGKNADKYTFKLLNKDPEQEERVVNLLIFEGQVIGGDVSSTKFGGSIESLKAKTEKTE
ncbi:MAG: DUF4830 domain-containing protein [Clostridia bacterium]|nr:DUF4830 domain-containing protein [Clostridia bacterium]